MKGNLFLGLGGNLGDVRESFRLSLERLANSPHFEVQKVSAAYRTAALTVSGIDSSKPSYWNIVLMLASDLELVDLLNFCQSLETENGRIRTNERWISRTLDIDILAWGSVQYHSKNLTVPHPRCLDRSFVLAPWAELSGDFTLTAQNGKATRVSDAWERLRGAVQPNASILEVDDRWWDKRAP